MSGWLQSANGSRISQLARIHNSQAVVVGPNITVGANAVIHGDVALAEDIPHAVSLGKFTYIGANCNIKPPEVKEDTYSPMTIGAYCVIGENSIVNLAKVGNRVIIEADCHLQNMSVIYECCLIRSGTIVPPKMVIPAYSEVSGTPGVDFKIESLNPSYKKLIELEAKQLNVLA